ncbi:DUF4386 family protein [Streptomyces sp. NPDC002671]
MTRPDALRFLSDGRYRTGTPTPLRSSRHACGSSAQRGSSLGGGGARCRPGAGPGRTRTRPRRCAGPGSRSALTAVDDWTFLLGPNVVLGANTLVLAWTVHRGRLVPRPLAGLGLVFAWEVCLAVRLLTHGFETAPHRT